MEKENEGEKPIKEREKNEEIKSLIDKIVTNRMSAESARTHRWLPAYLVYIYKWYVHIIKMKKNEKKLTYITNQIYNISGAC